MKRKPKTLGKLHADLLKLVQKYARISKADDNGYVVCYTCSKWGHYKEMDGGHFIPSALYPTRYEPDNIRPQCKRCNHVLQGCQAKFKENLISEIGLDGVERLECQTEITPGWDNMNSCDRREWLEKQIVEYERKIRILEKGIF